jgi:hypothetical protein
MTLLGNMNHMTKIITQYVDADNSPSPIKDTAAWTDCDAV